MESWLEKSIESSKGHKTKLSTVKKYLFQHGNFHEKLRVIHVAGTNGKGSICQMISQVLYKQEGYRVGLFLSPHLVDVEERIQINGVYIPSVQLQTYVSYVQAHRNMRDPLSFFATLFLAALHYFVDQGIDYLVCEVGVGGKDDATNVRSCPRATVISSIGYDHQRLLGPSLQKIQWHKMGIMKPGCVCYTSLDNPLMRYAAKIKKASLHLITNGGVECRHKGKYTSTQPSPPIYKTSLLGGHQGDNALLATCVLHELGVEQLHIQAGLLEVTHPGRCQRMDDNLLVDGAHNADGVDVLRKFIIEESRRFKRVVTVFGTCKRQEELQVFLSNLIQGDENYLIRPRVNRGRVPDEYAPMIPFATICSKMSVSEFIAQKRDPYDTTTLWVVYGSLYLIGELVQWDQQRKQKK